MGVAIGQMESQWRARPLVGRGLPNPLPGDGGPIGILLWLRGGANCVPAAQAHASRLVKGVLGGRAKIGSRSLEASVIGYWEGGRFERSRPVAVDIPPSRL